jgi:large subunit ribosomal protein L13
MTKTYSAKPSDVTRQWYVIDASEASIGRIATQVAQLLTGKGKPMFTSHIDTGDFVVIINAEKVGVTGKKLGQKMYYHHSHYPGGLKETTLQDKLATQPEEVLYQAVHGMLPVNKLRDARLKRLKIYAGAEHNHAAQKPQTISAKEIK